MDVPCVRMCMCGSVFVLINDADSGFLNYFIFLDRQLL